MAVGSLVFRELDLLGVSCCSADEFAAAVDWSIATANSRRASSRTSSPSSRRRTGSTYAMEHPGEVMKAVIRMEA